MKKSVFGVLFLVLLFCFSSSVLAERPITILLIDAMSGPAKSLGDRYFQAMQFAEEEINAKGGLMGRKVKMVKEDSQVKPDVAIRKAQKYLLKDEVDIIVVATGSHVAKGVKNLTKESNIPFINLTMNDAATGKEFSPHSIRLVYSSAMMARCLINYIANYKDFKKFYLINQDYSYGRDMAASFKEELKRQIPDAKIVGEDYHPLFSKDFSPFLTKIKASGAQCILTANWGPDISILAKQRNQLGVTAVIANNAQTDPLVLFELAKVSKGSIVSCTWMPTVDTVESEAFIKGWEERFKGSEYPRADNISARTYIAMKFLFEAINKAQSVEVKKLIPVMEGMLQRSLNGEVYLRACDHQLQSPLPVAEVVSDVYPYVSTPKMISAEDIATPKKMVENSRCR